MTRAIAALERAQGPAGADLGVDFTIGRLYARTGQMRRRSLRLQKVFEDAAGVFRRWGAACGVPGRRRTAG